MLLCHPRFLPYAPFFLFPAVHSLIKYVFHCLSGSLSFFLNQWHTYSCSLLECLSLLRSLSVLCQSLPQGTFVIQQSLSLAISLFISRLCRKTFIFASALPYLICLCKPHRIIELEGIINTFHPTSQQDIKPWLQSPWEDSHPGHRWLVILYLPWCVFHSCSLLTAVMKN